MQPILCDFGKGTVVLHKILLVTDDTTKVPVIYFYEVSIVKLYGMTPSLLVNSTS